MTNEQLIYWIEGYLFDKWSIEACAIKNKLSEMRGKPAVSKETTDFLQNLKPVPYASQTAPWVGTDV